MRKIYASKHKRVWCLWNLDEINTIAEKFGKVKVVDIKNDIP
jgi:hypothetical protein